MKHSSTIVVFYSCLVALELSLVPGQENQQRVFQQLTDPTKTLYYSSNPSVSRVDSRATCAITCVSLNKACNSFLYYNQEGLCSYGYWGWILTGNTPRNLSNELAFWSAGCHLVDNYRLESNEIEKICLWFSDDKGDYTIAKKNCTGRGLQLVTLKTTQKLTFFKNVANSKAVDQVWIGLDNLPYESNFHWVDNSTVGSDVLSEMSLSGHPQRLSGHYYQECVAYIPKTWSFNHDHCDVLKNYICEVILP